MKEIKIRKAVLVDLDATLVDVKNIRHLVESRPRRFEDFHNSSIDCPPNFSVLDRIVWRKKNKFTIIVISGRNSKFRRLSEFWLAMWRVPCDELIMRGTKNGESDELLKIRMFNFISRSFQVVEVIDDQQHLIDMWKSKGIKSVIDAKDLNFFDNRSEKCAP